MADWRTIQRIETCDDSELVRAASCGDRDAFAELYRRHLGAVLRCCHRNLGNTADAHDAAAETFAIAWQRLGEYRGDRGRFIDWLCGIARNLCRRSLRRGAIDHRATQRLGVRLPRPDRDDLDRVEELVDADRWRSAVAAALDTLSVKVRAVVEERVVLERSFADIAASQHITQAAVRKRLSRGLADLATQLSDKDTP
jgi:RNA polymerase sigma-70 factor (ECF subfamily)